MQTYHVKLESPVFESYRCKRAADSLDIDTKKKSIHEFKIDCDIESNFNVGLIVGASGSGKTTLAKKIYGENCFEVQVDESKSIIDQFDESLPYDDCANILSGIGLTSVPCWVRPVYTLSNGQKARAISALAMTKNDKVVIDEWTSVVDRTVAKVMSHCVQKHARKQNKQIVLVSCHYDVLEWLDPDWVIDCNKQQFIDRRLLHPSERRRKEQLEFQIREVDKSTWKYFSKYHYLSDKLPAYVIKIYGLFHDKNQIGFQCFANYTPHKNKKEKMIVHFNRTVIHPDYAGMGLGIHLINKTSELLKEKYRIMAKFSSIPVFKSLLKSNLWKLKKIDRQIGLKKSGGNMKQKTGFRENIKTYSFEYIG